MAEASAQGGVAFLRTTMAPMDRMYPNIQLQLCCSLIGGIFKQTWNMKDEVDVIAIYRNAQNCYLQKHNNSATLLLTTLKELFDYFFPP